MRKLDKKYIEKAFEVVEFLNRKEDSFISDNIIEDKKYKSYLASFGATVVMTGIEGAIFLYSNKDSDKVGVMNAITLAVSGLLGESIEKVNFCKGNARDFYLRISEKISLVELRDLYVNSSVGLKLVLRTYPVKGEGCENVK